MVFESHKVLQPAQQVNWRSLYEGHLEQSLKRMTGFVAAHAAGVVSPHLISIVTLLEESSTPWNRKSRGHPSRKNRARW